jgi:hypothetical protein
MEIFKHEKLILAWFQFTRKQVVSYELMFTAQPECRGTQGCREEVPGVPPNIENFEITYLCI